MSTSTKNPTLSSLPSGWEWTTLDDLRANEPNALTDGPFGSNLKSSDYVSTGIRVIRLGNIGVDSFQDDNKSYITEKKFEGLRKHEAFSGDLVIAALAEPVGRACEVPFGLGPAIVKADCIRFRPHPSVLGRFVLHALNSPQGKKRAEASSHGIGRLRINLDNLRNLPLPLAPALEQGRIVTKLESLLARSRRAKEALDTIPALLERLRQSILTAAFQGDLTTDWRAHHPDVEPASKLLERIRAERRRRWEEAELEKMRAKGNPPKNDSWKAKYEEQAPIDFGSLPALPEKWCWASVDDLLPATEPICYGVVQPGSETEGGIPLVRVCDLVEGTVEMKQLRTISAAVDEEYARSRLNGGEVLISVVGTIGRVSIAPPEARGANIARAVARLSFTSSIPVNWAASWLSGTYMQDRLNRDAREVARKTLNLSTLQRAPVPLAPVEEMSMLAAIIVRSIESARRLEATHKAIQQTADTLEPALLAKAFRGELVPQDPNDEPASVLLERIRAEREATAGSAPKRPRGRRPAA